MHRNRTLAEACREAAPAHLTRGDALLGLASHGIDECDQRVAVVDGVFG